MGEQPGAAGGQTPGDKPLNNVFHFNLEHSIQVKVLWELG